MSSTERDIYQALRDLRRAYAARMIVEIAAFGGLLIFSGLCVIGAFAALGVL